MSICIKSTNSNSIMFMHYTLTVVAYQFSYGHCHKRKHTSSALGFAVDLLPTLSIHQEYSEFPIL